jgi:hypothetical protein
MPTRQRICIVINSVWLLSIPDNRIIQPSFYEGSTKEIGSSQIGSSQISETQIGSTQVNIPQDSTFEVNESSSISSFSNYYSASKVSLTGSVSFQQLFSGNFPSHNITSNLFSNFKYSATNLWQTLFDPTFNINLQITDLPTGQLAEAQVTQFDQQGRPPQRQHQTIPHQHQPRTYPNRLATQHPK